VPTSAGNPHPQGQSRLPIFTIDRFEGPDWAVLEDERGQTVRVPRTSLPADTREGDVIDASDAVGDDATSVRFHVDPQKRAERLAEAERLRARLPRGPKGDLDL
jgi:hypothetical protein